MYKGKEHHCFIDRVGEVHKTKKWGDITIIEYHGVDNCSVQFEEGTIIKNIRYNHIKEGSVKNTMMPVICNIGYMGIGKYKSFGLPTEVKCGMLWTNIIRRCYTINTSRRNVTYIDCSVDERWHNFQNFAQWFYENYNPEIMEGWHLDKDILVKGNKIYSPETCCFVPNDINILFKKQEYRNPTNLLELLKQK